MPLATRSYRVLIDRTAQHRGLPGWNETAHRYTPGELLEGLVVTESSGNELAVRYEPHQDKLGRTDIANDPDTPGQDDLFMEDDKSYGLCQVMGYNIRSLLLLPPVLGIDFRFALNPVVNLALGVSVLKAELKATAGNVPRALARYNGGPSGEAGWPGVMRLQAYVEKVRKNCALVQADREAAGYKDKSLGMRWDDAPDWRTDKV